MALRLEVYELFRIAETCIKLQINVSDIKVVIRKIDQ